MKLTKKNRKAIEILRTTKEKQCFGYFTEETGGRCYFCAMAVLIKETTPPQDLSNCLGPSGNVSAKLQWRFALTNNGLDNLEILNDEIKLSFAEIADFMESNPRAFFF